MEGQTIEVLGKKKSESAPREPENIAEEILKPDSNEEQIIEKQMKENFHALKGISKFVGEYLEFFYKNFPDNRDQLGTTPGVMSWRHHPEYGYPKGSYLEIEKIFTKLPTMLSELAKDPKVTFSPECHLKHVLGNSPLMLAGWADRKADALIKKGGDLNSPENNTLERIREYKKLMDQLLVYLAFLEQHPDILIKELTGKDGWHEDLNNYYVGGVSDKKDGWSDIMLQHYIFFARVQGWQPQLGPLRLMPSLTTPIESAADFETVFNALPHHEILNKEKIYQELFEARQLPQEKAV